MFARLPLSSLVELCRVLRHSLDAGVPLPKVFHQLAQKGSGPVRALAERVGAALDRGRSLETALERERAGFPPLFLALAKVGEQTGNLPEIFGALETHYRARQKLRRQMLSQCLLPALQLVAAIFIIAGLIFVLGLIAEQNPGPGPRLIDPLRIGLTGTSGAILFLGLAFGILSGLAVFLLLAGRFLPRQATVMAVLLKAPIVGPCLYDLALARFCLALRLTLEAALPVGEALGLSLQASGNAAFAVRASRVQERVRTGDDLVQVLGHCGLFGTEFLSVVAVAEESGRLPEVMRQQGEHYEKEVAYSLSLLLRLAGFGIWAATATLIILAIFLIAKNIFAQGG